MPQLYDRHIFYVRWHMLLDEGHSDFHTYSHQIRTPDCVPVYSFPSPRIYTSLIQSLTWHTAVRVDTSTTRISSPLKREMFIRHRQKNRNKRVEWQKFTKMNITLDCYYTWIVVGWNCGYHSKQSTERYEDNQITAGLSKQDDDRFVGGISYQTI